MLADALDSVLRQSWRPIECVVVDDGSTDGTTAVIDNWVRATEGQGDFVVRGLRQANGGAPSARNAGLRAARGEYIQYLDSDDLLLPDKLRASMEALHAHPDIEYVVTGRVFIEDGDVEALLDPARKVEAGLPAPRIVHGPRLAQLPAQTVLGLARRSLCNRVGPWTETLRRHQDWEYTTRLVGQIERALRLDAPLYAIRRHAQGRIDDLRRHPRDALDARLAAALSVEAYLDGRSAPAPNLAPIRSRLRSRYLKIARQSIKAGSASHLGYAIRQLLGLGRPFRAFHDAT
jgi:glycosyltransferase involved in cell wall biosynthesis